ncbi:MAG: ABC transporter ATP-binding protein [Deltaproteobacteria bacterium]|nr:ABC transporter ATP-binding protein [Deltaproteobacteria bacterium]
MSSAVFGRLIPRLFRPSSTVGRFLRKYRRQLAIGGTSLVLVDSLDVILPLIVMLAIDVVSGSNTQYSLLFCGLAYLTLILIQGVLRLVYRYFLSSTNVRTGDEVRSAYCAALLFAPVERLEREKSGDLVARVSSDVDTVSSAFDQGIITLFDALFYLISVPVIMLCLDWRLALIALLPLPLIPFIVVKNDKIIRERYRESQQNLSAISALAQESVLGSRVIKSFAAEQSLTEQYRALGTSYVASMLKLAKTESVFAPSLELVVAVSMLLVLLVGGSWVIQGTLTLGAFVALQRYTQQLLWPMQAVGISIGLYQRAVASSERTESVLSTPVEASGDSRPALPALGEPLLEFENVRFRYPGSAQLVLDSISFTVRRGEKVALVGDNGSGKSSLLALVPKLYLIESGVIRVCGVDVTKWDLKALRSLIGFVSQDILVLSGPISENIALSGDGSISEEEIRAASKIACLDSEVERLPEGYQTILGERGINLSGGQRQRLSIARAVTKRAPILILDDVFSSVDSNTEAAIRRGLFAEHAEQTQILVSHRLSTVRRVDRVLVLEKGRLVQSGTHQELVSQAGWYQRFYQEQRLVEELEQYSQELHSRHV